MGAYFIMVTSVPGVRPMSKICCRSAWSSDATDATTASFPISSVSSLTSVFLPRRPQGVAFMFTLANRLPRLTNLTMHDSANMQRCSIDRSVQREFWDAVSPRTETAARLPRQNDSFSCVACVTNKECPRVTAQQERPQLPAAFRRNSKSPRWQQMSPARA